MAKRKPRWHVLVGGPGYWVRVYERTRGGVLYLATPDPSKRQGQRHKGGYRVESLKHRDKAVAVQEAQERFARWCGGARSDHRLTLGALVDRYLATEGSRMKAGTRRWLLPALESWRGHFGEAFPVEDLGYAQWEEYKRLRLSGAIDANGATVADAARRRPVLPGTLNLSLEALTMALNWACVWREGDARLPLLERSPVKGLKFADNVNVRRAVWSQDRFEKVLRAAEALTMQVEWHGKRERVRCHLADVLVLASETGRRIGAVRQLRPCDLRLEADDAAPFGRIVWPPETDKKRKAWTTPITAAARERLLAVLRARPVAGDGPLFPAPRDVTQAVDRETLASWQRKAEGVAKVPRLEHDTFHGLRRRFVTERKRLPDKDVAALGGWRSVNVMKRAYQHADEFGMLEALLHPQRLRDVARGS